MGLYTFHYLLNCKVKIHVKIQIIFTKAVKVEKRRQTRSPQNMQKNQMELDGLLDLLRLRLPREKHSLSAMFLKNTWVAFSTSLSVQPHVDVAER